MLILADMKTSSRPSVRVCSSGDDHKTQRKDTGPARRGTGAAPSGGSGAGWAADYRQCPGSGGCWGENSGASAASCCVSFRVAAGPSSFGPVFAVACPSTWAGQACGRCVRDAMRGGAATLAGRPRGFLALKRRQKQPRLQLLQRGRSDRAVRRLLRCVSWAKRKCCGSSWVRGLGAKFCYLSLGLVMPR